MHTPLLLLILITAYGITPATIQASDIAPKKLPAKMFLWLPVTYQPCLTPGEGGTTVNHAVEPYPCHGKLIHDTKSNTLYKAVFHEKSRLATLHYVDARYRTTDKPRAFSIAPTIRSLDFTSRDKDLSGLHLHMVLNETLFAIRTEILAATPEKTSGHIKVNSQFYITIDGCEYELNLSPEHDVIIMDEEPRYLAHLLLLNWAALQASTVTLHKVDIDSDTRTNLTFLFKQSAKTATKAFDSFRR